MIPAISSLTPITTAIPLIGVLTLTAVKDAYDDFVSTSSLIRSHSFLLFAKIRSKEFSMNARVISSQSFKMYVNVHVFTSLVKFKDKRGMHLLKKCNITGIPSLHRANAVI